MEKKKIKYIWNIISVLLVIIIAESTYHFYLIPKKEPVLHNFKINTSCEVPLVFTYSSGGFCKNLLALTNKSVKMYISKKFEVKDKIVMAVRDNLSFIAYGAYGSELSINNDEINNILNKDTKIFFDIAKNRVLIDKNLLLLKIWQKRINAAVYANNNPELYLFLDLYRETDQRLLLNVKKIKEEIKLINIIKSENILSFKTSSITTKELQSNKFNRLNYLNIFFISLVLGIFLNILFILLIDLIRLNKMNLKI